MPRTQRVQWLNALPNLFWSALFLLPVYWFWRHWFDLRWAIVAVACGMPAYLAPHRWLDRLRLSPNPATYRQLGVPLVNRLTQDSAWIKRIAGHAPALRRDAATAAKLLRKTWERERFHLFLLIFFGVSTVYALALQAWGWSGFLLVSNIGFNLYPVWLQQYLRLRLERIQR
jgi:hypothetical protein